MTNNNDNEDINFLLRYSELEQQRDFYQNIVETVWRQNAILTEQNERLKREVHRLQLRLNNENNFLH